MKAMKRKLIIIALCTLCLPRLQAQGVDEVLQSVAQHNKALQAQRQADAAEKTGIEAENGLEDPSVEYSSFFSKGVSGQAGSELVVSQGFDFPTVYGQRSRAGRERKEAVDLRAEALRRVFIKSYVFVHMECIYSVPRNFFIGSERIQHLVLRGGCRKDHIDSFPGLEKRKYTCLYIPCGSISHFFSRFINIYV